MTNRYLQNTFRNIKRERLMSMTILFVMTITFLLLGIFMTVVTLSQTVLRNLEQQAQVTIFFNDDFGEDRILPVKDRLITDTRILSVNYISKEDAYNIFKEINKDEPVLLESVTSGILPASLEIRARDIADLPKLAEEFNSLEGVEEVRFFSDVISNFRKFSSAVYIVGFSLVFVFVIISYAVVLSTLRSTINSKGTEYEIMKLVGATNAYVKMPLIYQGVFYGLTSSFIAGFLLFVFLTIFGNIGYLPSALSFGFIAVSSVSPVQYALILWLILAVSGGVLGYLGSTLAVRRYLKY